jgi:hypothetical protein
LESDRVKFPIQVPECTGLGVLVFLVFL